VWVQQASHRAIDSNTDFLAEAIQHPMISKYLTKKELEKVASIQHGLRNVGDIYKRVLGEMKL
jgi:adenylosuccinate lyase